MGSNSGGDESIGGARGLFDMVVNDGVDATTGDNTDYKYFDIDERGSVTIRIRFQQIGVTGSVAIHNDYGDILHNQGISPEEQEVRIEDFDVLPGRYYVSLSIREGRADYAIGRDFTAAVAAVVCRSGGG